MTCVTWSFEKIQTVWIFRAIWENTAHVQWISCSPKGSHLIYWTSAVFSHIALKWTLFAYLIILTLSSLLWGVWCSGHSLWPAFCSRNHTLCLRGRHLWSYQVWRPPYTCKPHHWWRCVLVVDIQPPLSAHACNQHNLEKKNHFKKMFQESMLVHRLRRWPNIDSTLAGWLVLAEMWCGLDAHMDCVRLFHV